MDSAAAEPYTLSLHDALPIFRNVVGSADVEGGILRESVGDTTVEIVAGEVLLSGAIGNVVVAQLRSEEHTSELQSRENLVCRLLLEKKKNNRNQVTKESRKPC